MRYFATGIQFRIAYAVPLLAASLLGVRGAVIGTPGTGLEGGYYVYEPFGLVESGQVSCRYQQVYDADEFLRELPNGGVITALYVVSDFTFGHGFNAILPDIRIDMAITPRDPDQLSPVFSQNIGGNLSTVFSGSLALTAQADGRGQPVYIGLTTPFFYDPGSGNLLLDIRNVAQIPTPNIPLTRVGPLNASNNEFAQTRSRESLPTT